MSRATGLAGLVVALALIGCVSEPPATSHTPTLGVEVPWTSDACRAAARDEDGDGLDDSCELSVAGAFAPELIVDPRDCLWNGSLHPARLDGGYLVAVQPLVGNPQAVRIAYLAAYLRDCGWQGAPCLTRGPGCSAHSGDSELVVVDARYDVAEARWVSDAVFLSAHCLGRSDGRCRWYARDALRQFSWAGGRVRGAPRVWVAKGKHANYPSRGACDSGHWFYDSCDGNTAAYRFPVTSIAQNIGSRRRPLPNEGGCIGTEQLPWPSAGPERQTVECFWDPARPFRGWQRDEVGRAPAAYARLLAYAAGF